MSARDELFEALMPPYWAQYAPGEEDSTNALIDAFRAEVLREAAERIRGEGQRLYDNDAPPINYDQYRGMRRAAKLIDPEAQ